MDTCSLGQSQQKWGGENHQLGTGYQLPLTDKACTEACTCLEVVATNFDLFALPPDRSPSLLVQCHVPSFVFSHAQLAQILHKRSHTRSGAPYSVHPIPVPHGLHLKSAITAACDDNTLIFCDDAAGQAICGAHLCRS